MKKCLIFLFLLPISVISHGQDDEWAKEKMLDFLGKEKAKAFENLHLAFDVFLKENYGHDSDIKNLREFLMEVSDYNQSRSWGFTNTFLMTVFDEVRVSGLRKELYLIGDETYLADRHYFSLTNSRWDTLQIESIDSGKMETDFEDIIEIPQYELSKEEMDRIKKREKELEEIRKTYLTPNLEGDFLFSLALVQDSDEMVKEYLVAIIESAGGIHPVSIAGRLSSFEDNMLISFAIKSIIIVELFYPMLHKQFYK